MLKLIAVLAITAGIAAGSPHCGHSRPAHHGVRPAGPPAGAGFAGG